MALAVPHLAAAARKRRDLYFILDIKMNQQITERPLDIIDAVSADPGTVLMDTKGFEQFVARLRADAPRDLDISKTADRSTIRSYAAMIKSHKAAINKSRLALTEKWRASTKQANDAGKIIDAELESLANEIRRPLTQWETAEKQREELVETTIAGLKSSRFVPMGEKAESIKARGYKIGEMTFDKEVFRDRYDEAVAEHKDTIAHLLNAMSSATKAEEAEAELAQLRAEKDAQIKADADRAAKEHAEAQRKAEAEAEEKRTEQLKADAAEQVRQEEQRKQEEAENKRRYARSIIAHIREVANGKIGGQPQPYAVLLRELDEKIVIDDRMGDLQEEVRAVHDSTRKLLQAGMERAAEVKRQQEAEAAQRQAEEEAAEAKRKSDQEAAQRQADQDHRTKVKAAAKNALMTCGADEDTARKIVLAILAGEIPHIRLEF